MRSDVYAEVTDRIIADLEKGELTWLVDYRKNLIQLFISDGSA
jgi:antirestriction protein ArdC